MVLFIFSTNVSYLRHEKWFYLFFLQMFRTYGTRNGFIYFFYKCFVPTAREMVLFIFSTNVSYLRHEKWFYLFFLQMFRTYGTRNGFIYFFYKCFVPTARKMVLFIFFYKRFAPTAHFDWWFIYPLKPKLHY